MDSPYSDNNYGSSSSVFDKAVLVIAICMGLLGVYTIYCVFTSGIDWGYKVNWNCFESPLFSVLSVIGFFLQFFNWQHTSFDTWIGTKKVGEDERERKWEKSNDIMDATFGGCLFPLLAHLLIIPCAYGAAMWYAIMGLVHVLGKLSPFLITLLIIGFVIAFYFLGRRINENKYRVVLLIFLTLVEAGSLGFVGYYMKNHASISFFGSTSSISSNYKSLGECKITGNGVNLRVGPGTNYKKSGITVSNGETYSIVSESGSWVEIDYKGQRLWISNKFCHLTYNNAGNDAEDEDLGCYAQEDEESQNSYGTSDSESSPTETSNETGSFTVVNPIPGAMVYSGMLDGKYEIVMQLVESSGGKLSGNYYYTKYKTPIQIYGELDQGTVRLEERTNGNLTGYFIGNIRGTTFDGVWQSVDESKIMDCTLHYVKTN